MMSGTIIPKCPLTPYRIVMAVHYFEERIKGTFILPHFQGQKIVPPTNWRKEKGKKKHMKDM